MVTGLCPRNLVVLVTLGLYTVGQVNRLVKRVNVIADRLAALQTVADAISKGQDNIWDKVFEIEARGRPEPHSDP